MPVLTRRRSVVAPRRTSTNVSPAAWSRRTARIGPTRARSRAAHLLLAHRDRSLGELEIARRQTSAGGQSAFALQIELRVAEDDLALVERGRGFVAARDEIALIQLREQLPFRDGVADPH